MYSDSVLIIFIAICTALLGEGNIALWPTAIKSLNSVRDSHVPHGCHGNWRLDRCAILISLTYVLVYRSDKYKKLKADIEKKTKRLEKRKDQLSEIDRSNKKRIEREEERLKVTSRDLSMFKMKSMFAIGFAFTALLSTFSSIFEGRVVAKLPFTPISWVQGLSHRSLPGEDFTDCSFIFLYILCTMSIRQNLQKVLGFAPSRAMNRQTQGAGGLFGPPPQSSNYNYFK